MTNADVSDWKSFEDFAAGIETNRLPSTSLDGTELGVAFTSGGTLELRFLGDSGLVWSSSSGDVTDGRGWYDAVELGDDLLLLDTTFAERPRESITLVVNRATRAVLAVTSTIDEVKQPGLPRVRQEFTVGVCGDPAVPAGGPLPAPTRELIGRRAVHRYSDNHLYEHVYLSSERYCWQCLEGVERGLADVDAATTYKLDADRYLLAFREYVLDVASVFVLDFRHRRNTGKFFGITEDGIVENAPTGAFITEIGPAGYPGGVDPV